MTEKNDDTEESSGRRPPESLLIQIRQVDAAAATRREMWKSIRWIGVALFTYLCIRELAGRETLATFIVDAFIAVPERGVSAWWVTLAIMAGMWACGERWLRLRKVESMSDRIKQLERSVDPGRTSSGLTSRGETPRP